MSGLHLLWAAVSFAIVAFLALPMWLPPLARWRHPRAYVLGCHHGRQGRPPQVYDRSLLWCVAYRRGMVAVHEEAMAAKLRRDLQEATEAGGDDVDG